MRALIVYESMYGNTRAIAEAVADGARTGMRVTVRPACAVTPGEVAEADLVVAGAPTHLHTMPRPITREAAAKAAAADGAPRLEPEARGPGMREWLRTLAGGSGRLAAVFDTRVVGSAHVTGRAGLRIARRIRRAGFTPATPPASFLVDRRNRLVEGEKERARAWGKAMAVRFTDTPEAAKPDTGS